MEVAVAPFDFEYLPTEVVFGRGCVDTLAAKLESRGLSRALVVCGKNVGANHEVIDPVKAGLGDRLVDVFDETTPEKDIEMAFDGVERIHEGAIDAVVALGSGSSINVARAMCVIEAVDRPYDEIAAEIRETGTFPFPDEDGALIPNFSIPTTMAGADLTYDGGVMLSPKPGSAAADDTDRISGRISDPRLMPEALFYDPNLFATTPTSILTSSAMNGFNKGIETVYSRLTNPLSEAHALHGLRYLRAGLPGLRHASPEDVSIDQSVIGIVLVQYGRYTNLIHTFGNGVSAHYDVQQGTVHGIISPHVLRYIFDRVDARRQQLAQALGIDPTGKTDAEIADAIIDEVIAVRDALGLPSHLRSVDGLEREHLPAVAEATAGSHKHARNPPGIDPTVDELLQILETAW